MVTPQDLSPFAWIVLVGAWKILSPFLNASSMSDVVKFHCFNLKVESWFFANNLQLSEIRKHQRFGPTLGVLYATLAASNPRCFAGHWCKLDSWNLWLSWSWKRCHSVTVSQRRHFFWIFLGRCWGYGLNFLPTTWIQQHKKGASPNGLDYAWSWAAVPFSISIVDWT